jgi:hypothetical protein
VERSEEWITGRRYLEMEELREHRRIGGAKPKRRCSWSGRRRVRLLAGNYRNVEA